MTDFEAALAVLEGGTREEVNTLLVGLTPQERKALGPKFRRWLTHGSTVRVPRDRESLAVIATADGVRQARLFATHGWGLTEEFVEDAVEILGQRSPAWLPAFVESILADEGAWNWRVARGIVRAGLAPEPDHPEYFRGTVRGVPDYNMQDRRPLVEHVGRDPGLIGDHLFTMLSTEGVGRLLAFHDGYMERRQSHLPDLAEFPAGTWRIALLTLTREQRLDRGRLLDNVIAAPLRDWAAADLGWYIGMHDALEPTVDEVAERQGTYARLLTVEHGPSVKTAQRELLRLMPDERFEPDLILAASSATLGRSDKATVAAHLRLLEKLAKTHPNAAITDTVRIATEHARGDVRAQAVKILARLGAAEAPSDEAAPFVPAEPEARTPAVAVQPVRTEDELSEVLLGLFEEIDPLEMERAIDGLLRLADTRPSTADLLTSRAAAAEHYQDDPRIAARVLTLAWLTPRKRFRDGEWPILLGHTIFPADAAAPHTFVGAIGRRLTGIAHAVREGRHTSLALPSRADFTLDADELNRRLSEASRTRPILELELVVALLRVPPALRSLVEVPRSMRKSPAVAAAREGGRPRWLRRVARYRRMNWEPERRIPVFLDEMGSEGHAAAGILARSRPEATLGPECSYGEYEPRFEQTLGVGAALLPHDLDVLAAHTHPYLHRDLRKDRACAVPVVDAIARATTVNGPPASSALVLALAAKDARGRTAAQDAVLELARHGLLNGAELGRQAALLLADDIVVGQRVSGGLSECARASDAAVPPILDALQEVAPALPGRRDAGAFLQLAADLAERTGRTIDLPTEFRELASQKSSSMVAKAARRLLEVRRLSEARASSELRAVSESESLRARDVPAE